MKRLFPVIIYVILIPIIFTVGIFSYLYTTYSIDFTRLEHKRRALPSVVLDDEGNELCRFAFDKRTRVTYDQIPEVVVRAFVAAEDHAFFSHMGISVKGVIRSALVNLYYRRVVQGASTITQQVARLLFLSHERTFLRKAHEVFLALQLERHLTKEQILELYLNNVYFGRGIYGIEAAAQRFWGKPVKDVSLVEAATLAAVAKSARFYSPLNAPLTAKRRRNTVLRCMCNVGFITNDECVAGQKQELEVRQLEKGSRIFMYIQEWIRRWAEDKWGKDALYRKGLTIQTTLNKVMQENAEQSFTPIVRDMRKKMTDSLNGGVVVLHGSSGAMKVLIGGFDFVESQFNRAFQAYRQVGSSFKPILYALALCNGYDMDSIVVDEPIEIEQPGSKVWKPRNASRRFEGPMTLIRALTYSNNVVAIKLLLEIGVHKLNTLLKKFGITRDLTLYPTSALGTAHANVVENAAAFNVFANNGVRVEPYLVSKVKNRWGKVIWRHAKKARRVLSPLINAKMLKALTYRMKFARPRWHNGWVDCESIGKTGSTNGAATVWFVGATPEYTSAVYLGRDDNKPLGRYVYANKTAFPVWLNLFKKHKSSVKNFYFDSQLEEVSIDWKTGEHNEVNNGSRSVTILK